MNAMRLIQLIRPASVCSLGALFITARQIDAAYQDWDERRPTDFRMASMSTPGPNGVKVVAGKAITWNGYTQTLTCRSNENTPVYWNVSCIAEVCGYNQYLMTRNGSMLAFVANSSWNSSIITCRSLRSSTDNDRVSVTIIVRESPRLKIIPSPVKFYNSRRFINASCSADTSHVWPPDLQWGLIYGTREDAHHFDYDRIDGLNQSNVRALLPSHELPNRIACDYEFGVLDSLNFPRVVAYFERVEEPSVQIDQVKDAYSVGSEVLLLCYAKGYVIGGGGLVWRVQCTTCAYDEDDFKLKSLETNYSRTLTFIASRYWKDVAVTCHLADYEYIKSTITVKLKYSPEIEIYSATAAVYPSIVEAYVSSSVTLLCRARGLSLLRGDWNIQWLFVKGSKVRDYNLSYDIQTNKTESYLRFTAGSLWEGCVVKCQLNPPTNEEPPIHLAATVDIYDPPTLSIINGESIVLLVGEGFTLTCVADGYVLGGLRWTIDCSNCIHQQEVHSTQSSWGANNTLKFTATSSWNGTRITCAVKSSNWPQFTATINVKGYGPGETLSTVEWLAPCGIAATIGAILLGALVVLLLSKNQVRAQALREASPVLLAPSSGGPALPAQRIEAFGHTSFSRPANVNVEESAATTAMPVTRPVLTTADAEDEGAAPQRDGLEREEIISAALQLLPPAAGTTPRSPSSNGTRFVANEAN